MGIIVPVGSQFDCVLLGVDSGLALAPPSRLQARESGGSAALPPGAARCASVLPGALPGAIAPPPDPIAQSHSLALLTSP